MTLVHRITAATSVCLLAFALSACGDGNGPAQGTSPTPLPAPQAVTSGPKAVVDQIHNEPDAEFAQMMIVHHEGAIEMADLAIEKAESAEVRTLAEGISAAQGPEITEMTTWLQSWGEDTAPGHGSMDHGGMDMKGMSQDEVMADLGMLSGAEFDQRFLELMIDHHLGAVEMAQRELENGENTQALVLAEQIIEAQRAEISDMEQMRLG